MPHRVSIMSLTNNQAQQKSFKFDWDKESKFEKILKKKVRSEHFSKTSFLKVLESAKISLDKSQLFPYIPPGLNTQEILLWI